MTVTTGTSALVILYAYLWNDTGGQWTQAAYRVTGATSISASGSLSISYESSNANDKIRTGASFLVESLTAGSNTFTMAGLVSGGTGTIDDARIVVLPF